VAWLLSQEEPDWTVLNSLMFKTSFSWEYDFGYCGVVPDDAQVEVFACKGGAHDAQLEGEKIGLRKYAIATSLSLVAGSYFGWTTMFLMLKLRNKRGLAFATRFLALLNDNNKSRGNSSGGGTHALGCLDKQEAATITALESTSAPLHTFSPESL
jgi:hypothetical protein